MDDILAKKNRHLFLEEKDNVGNSFIANVNKVAESTDVWLALKDHEDEIVTVSENIDDISTVAENIDNVNTVADNIDDIEFVHSNIEDGTLEALLDRISNEGNDWLLRIAALGNRLLNSKNAFNYAAVATIPSDIAANATITLPESMSYLVGTHMLLLSWNGTVCYKDEQYKEIGTADTWSTTIKTLVPLKAGDKLEFRTVAVVPADTQVIATGSLENRTLADRFGDVCNVKDFGAVGDGVENDTAAFQAALATGRAVFVPEGSYKLTTNLTGDFCSTGNSTFTGGTINGSTILRGTAQRNGDIINVKDFGAKGDGITDDKEAIQAMITAVGYAFFLAGNYHCDTATFDAPLKFGPGAALVVSDDDTVTITGPIDAPRQQIFKGDGNIALRNDSDSGEDARMVHVSWFGAFPGNPDALDSQTVAIQKACDSLGNTREGTIQFDVGSYVITETINVRRATWIKGEGTRRTVFRAVNDDGPLFQADEDGCRFTGIQQEYYWDSQVSKRTHPFIALNGLIGEAFDISSTNATAVEITGMNCKVSKITGVVNKNLGTGSALVICKNSGCTIDDVYQKTSSVDGFESLVLVDSSSNVLGHVQISNLYHICRSRSVTLKCGGYNLSDIMITNVISNIFSTGSNINACIFIENNTNAVISHIQINEVNTSGYLDYLLLVNQTGTGTTQDIHLDNACAGADHGIKLNKTAGVLNNITFGDMIDLLKATTPFEINGATQVRVAPQAYKNALPPCSYDYTIDDDSVEVIDLYRTIFTGFLMVSIGYANYGIYVVRAASSSPTLTAISVSSNMEAVATSLSGTTGTDGKFTVGVQNGKVYLENRLGSEQRVSCTLLTGIY